MSESLLETIADDERQSTVASLLSALSLTVNGTAAEAVEAFEACCRTFLGQDDITMESGVYAFSGTEEFSVNLMRHFKSDGELWDFDLQIVLAFTCPPDGENEAIRESFERGEPALFEEEKALDEFFNRVRASETYAYLTGDRQFHVEVLLESM